MSVERVLNKHGIEHKSVGSSFLIRCLSPDHEDNNPSMLVNKYTGSAKCMSCQEFYNVFKLFNEKTDFMTIRKEKFREKLRQVAFDSMELNFPETTVMWKNSFRGISASTLKHFEAFQCADFPGYICFPLRSASGKIINFIGRDTSGIKSPKYIFFHKKRVPMSPYKPIRQRFSNYSRRLV